MRASAAAILNSAAADAAIGEGVAAVVSPTAAEGSAGARPLLLFLLLWILCHQALNNEPFLVADVVAGGRVCTAQRQDVTS